MSDLAAPVSLLTPVPTAPGAGLGAAALDKIRKTAQDFESSFLSEMYKPMFEGLSTDGPFGGGDAENTWRGFMIDAMAKQTVKAGGVGLADTVMAEMIKMQEARQ